MDASSPFCQTGRARLLLVTLAIASATAAVAAGVALTDRRLGEAGASDVTVAPAMPASPRHAPLSETATTLPELPLDATTTPGDSSLPAASDALTGKDSAGRLKTPTF